MVMVREIPRPSRRRGQRSAVPGSPKSVAQPTEHDDALQQDLADFQRLIDQLTADGCLARWDEEAILSALVAGDAYSTAKCALFRQLQERVWRAELYLEP